ncbi:MAG: non-heme iron oxygenase ferredoxin subunit [Planctomycetota bacterium]|nr:non-heme iron oxygenase ferredoxin subunit [Planctomycetota bacterium]
MAEYQKVLKKVDLKDGQGKCVVVGGKAIAIFLAAGQFYAVDDLCTHAEASLADGWLTEDCRVACPWHGAEFDLKTGEAKTPPAFDPVKTYPVRVSGEDVEIEV